LDFIAKRKVNSILMSFIRHDILRARQVGERQKQLVLELRVGHRVAFRVVVVVLVVALLLQEIHFRCNRVDELSHVLSSVVRDSETQENTLQSLFGALFKLTARLESAKRRVRRESCKT
jgi:hypothetical protein